MDTQSIIHIVRNYRRNLLRHLFALEKLIGYSDFIYHYLFFCRCFMVTVDAAGRIRLSREASRGAGFRPGQKLAVVSEGQNSFRIQSAAKTAKSVDSARYSVEQDGRIRVSKTAVRNLGVKSRRKNMTADVQKGSIVVTM
jgi:hypothetical protein